MFKKIFPSAKILMIEAQKEKGQILNGVVKSSSEQFLVKSPSWEPKMAQKWTLYKWKLAVRFSKNPAPMRESD